MSDLLSSRRRFLRMAALSGAGFAFSRRSLADDPPVRSSGNTDYITAETQAAIDRGLSYLSRAQGEDGAYYDSNGPNVAITGLAGLALMAGGHQPGRGQYGANVSRAMDYVLSRANGPTPGYLTASHGVSNHSGMYQHGFGSLFLSEVYGMVPDRERQKRLRDGLEKAIALIVRAQNKEGGWRYQPRPSEADVSVTVAQLMALRAARNAGVFVPKSTVDASVKYIKDCQLEDGGFCYIRGNRVAGSLFPRSAAAIVGLYSAGIYDGREIDRGLKYLMRFIPSSARAGGFRDPRTEMHYFYAHYYAALAMWTAGGNYWAEWFPAIRDDLLARSRVGAGGWHDFAYGSTYATAMACIILQLPNNYLPILQK
jgi:hypothetical protein